MTASALTMTNPETALPSSSVKVWDGAIRLFHWSMAAMIVAMWWTAENHAMDWHRRIGMVLVGLVVFRLYWGVFGSTTARFSSFVRGPKAILAYFKKLTTKPYVPDFGHNPLGALSVIALLLAVMFQLTAGLFAVDTDGLESGPLSRFVDFDTGRMFAELHETGFNVLLWLIGLHLVAVALYTIVLRANLIIPMITGSRKSQPTGEAAPVVKVSIIRLVIGVAISAGVVWYLFGL